VSAQKGHLSSGRRGFPFYTAALSADAFFIGQWSFVIDAWEIQFDDSHDQMTGEELPVADGD